MSSILSASKFLILGTVLALAHVAYSATYKTLVLLDDWATIETHSIFFDSLRSKGQDLQFEMITPVPAIRYYEEYYHDNIILMAPSVKGININP